MNNFTAALSGMVGGLISVALVAVLVSGKSKTPELIKESFKGFTNVLGTAMGSDTKMG